MRALPGPATAEMPKRRASQRQLWQKSVKRLVLHTFLTKTAICMIPPDEALGPRMRAQGLRLMLGLMRALMREEVNASENERKFFQDPQ